MKASMKTSLPKLVTTTLSTVALLAAPFVANAGTTTTTIAEILLVDDPGLIYVYPTGGVQGAPACHGSNGSYYSFKVSRPMSKQYLAALLAAQAKGATVRLYGAGACTDQSVSETLSYLSVLN